MDPIKETNTRLKGCILEYSMLDVGFKEILKASKFNLILFLVIEIVWVIVLLFVLSVLDKQAGHPKGMVTYQVMLGQYVHNLVYDI